MPNAAHLHLILNHIPVLGAAFGLLLLGYGLLRDSDEIARTALWVLVIVGVAGGAVYLTGEPAEEIVEGLAGVSDPAIERHEEMALWAMIGGGVVGLAALFGLFRYRGRTLARPFATLVLALTLGLSGLMGWTANLGGHIRHSEIRPDGAAQVDAPAEGREAGEADED